MKKALLIALLFAGLGTATATAEPYVSASLGIGMPSDLEVDYGNLTIPAAFDSGIAFNAAVGYDFGQARAELAIGYQEHGLGSIAGEEAEFWDDYGIDINNVEASALSVMANTYYDIELNGSPAEPYIMGGIGIASLDLDYFEGETSFAFQLGAGIGYALTDNVTFDLGYRFLKPTGFELEGYDASIETHNIMAGIRYGF